MVALSLTGISPIVFEWKGGAESVSLEEVLFVLLVMTSPPAAVIVAIMSTTLFSKVFTAGHR